MWLKQTNNNYIYLGNLKEEQKNLSGLRQKTYSVSKLQ